MKFTGQQLSTQNDVQDVLALLAPALDFQHLADQVDLDPALRRSPTALAEAYLGSEALLKADPNRFFHEMAYRGANPDVEEAIDAGDLTSGLMHFLQYGMAEGRIPNTDLIPCSLPHQKTRRIDLKEAAYFSEFASFFPSADPLHLMETYAFAVSPSDVAMEGFYNALPLLFDHDHYSAQKPEAAEWTRDFAIADYFAVGAAEGLSPVKDFDEAFYLAFYDDVRIAVSQGNIFCGFHHYYASGQTEGRLARHDIKNAVEARARGLTNPVALQRLDDLEARMRPPLVVPRDDNDRVIHVVLPDLNPDIEFAGFKSIIEIIKELRRRNKTVHVVKTNSSFDGLNYFRYHNRNDAKTLDLIEDIEATPARDAVTVGRNDRVIAYSTWDCYYAKGLAAETDEARFSFLIQEYEPIFYEHNSFHFFCAQAYRMKHFPIFNSQLLTNYFQKREKGIFANAGAVAGKDYCVFEHIVSTPKALNIEERDVKNFFMYARPEAHAGRNLLEVKVLALRQFLAEHDLDGKWRFMGLGALTKRQEIALSPKHQLTIQNRMPFDEYQRTMQTIDVGMSLMYAPHPSVVPLELLANGAVVVTNTFSNRDVDDLKRFSDNMIPVDLELDAIVEGLATAFKRAEDLEARRKAVFAPHQNDWSIVTKTIVDRLEKEDLA